MNAITFGVYHRMSTVFQKPTGQDRCQAGVFCSATNSEEGGGGGQL